MMSSCLYSPGGVFDGFCFVVDKKESINWRDHKRVCLSLLPFNKLMACLMLLGFCCFRIPGVPAVLFLAKRGGFGGF